MSNHVFTGDYAEDCKGHELLKEQLGHIQVTVETGFKGVEKTVELGFRDVEACIARTDR